MQVLDKAVGGLSAKPSFEELLHQGVVGVPGVLAPLTLSQEAKPFRFLDELDDFVPLKVAHERGLVYVDCLEQCRTHEKLAMPLCEITNDFFREVVV